MAFTLSWSKQSRAGAISGAIGGLLAGLTAWLAEAQVYYGEITLASTGANYPTLAGIPLGPHNLPCNIEFTDKP